MEASILTSTKKILGIAADYTAFDLDVITHINTALNTLTQLGIGPSGGFMIEDETAMWDDFIEEDLLLNSAKTYVFLKVRILFDPPTTSFVLAAIQEQIAQLEWRISVHRESYGWIDPNPVEVHGETVDGGVI